VLVCPTWWPQARVECVRTAAAAGSSKVSVLQRAEALSRGVAGDPTVVEIAAEFVVSTRAGTIVAADARLGETLAVARSVANHIGRAQTVLVDAPVGVVGAVELAAAISECLTADGISVTTVRADRVLHRMEKPLPRRKFRPEPARRGSRSALMVAAAASISVTRLCMGLAEGADEGDTTSVPLTLLVEGRIALKVPALWEVRRIVSGPGSARVQVTAPDGSASLLVTQAHVSTGETLAMTAAALRNALDDQDADVFSNFDADGRRANRPAVTYRELRGAHQIDWTVLVDGTLRMAVGCQSARGGEEAVRHVCDEAIQSVHAVS
jgi:type VII secretion-associated protein (TIGR03931 family)